MFDGSTGGFVEQRDVDIVIVPDDVQHEVLSVGERGRQRAREIRDMNLRITRERESERQERLLAGEDAWGKQVDAWTYRERREEDQRSAMFQRADKPSKSRRSTKSATILSPQVTSPPRRPAAHAVHGQLVNGSVRAAARLSTEHDSKTSDPRAIQGHTGSIRSGARRYVYFPKFCPASV